MGSEPVARSGRHSVCRKVVERRLRGSEDARVEFAPAEGEVRVIAELLGRRPDEVAAIKLPGPGRLLESPLTSFGAPKLNGFDMPEHLEVAWDAETPHPAARYDSPQGSLIVVSHETGPEIFFAVAGGAAAAATVIRGAYDFIQWVRSRREKNGAPPDVVDAQPVQFWFYDRGRLRRRDVLPLEPPETTRG